LSPIVHLFGKNYEEEQLGQLFYRGNVMTPNFCGRTRREFLWQAGGGFAGTALAGLLGNSFFARQSLAANGIDEWVNPLAPKQPHFPAKAKSVIFLFMYGGPSHIDTFDYKPDMVGMDNKTVQVKTSAAAGTRTRGGSSSRAGNSNSMASAASGSLTCSPTSPVTLMTSPSSTR
jgi:hypothetical protein